MGGRSRVDEVNEVRLGGCRVSCKGDSEQGQGRRNPIPEPRREQVTKTSSSREGHGPERGASPRTEEGRGLSLILLRSHGEALMVHLLLT